jgi:hypothetical protein
VLLTVLSMEANPALMLDRPVVIPLLSPSSEGALPPDEERPRPPLVCDPMKTG